MDATYHFISIYLAKLTISAIRGILYLLAAILEVSCWVCSSCKHLIVYLNVRLCCFSRTGMIKIYVVDLVMNISMVLLSVWFLASSYCRETITSMDVFRELVTMFQDGVPFIPMKAEHRPHKHFILMIVYGGKKRFGPVGVIVILTVFIKTKSPHSSVLFLWA